MASKLTNYEIDILTDKEDSERRQAEFKERIEGQRCDYFKFADGWL